jgi:hypothetical protein
MSPTWKPDDSVIEGTTGARRIRAALKKHGFIVKDRVITSRDPGMHEVRHELDRRDMPPGVRSWQLPVLLEDCPVFFFLTVADAGAVVPKHSHKRDLFRMVLSGSIITNGHELKLGDWMFVPSGVPYSYTAALNPGAIIMHCYG